ncbi:MAG TPA: hypothetical protein VKX40_07550 [Aequorivita sp.]|nr:hypothetical protein [Aequorivita sp.]
MMRSILLSSFFVFFVFGLRAQTTDLARVEYLHFPFSKSGNSITRYRALIQAPISLKKDKKNFLVIGLEYRYLDIDIRDEEDIAAFNGHLVSATQRMDGYLAYTWKQNYDWRFGVKAGIKIQSDLVGGLVDDDLVYEFGVYAVNDKMKNVLEGEKPWRLIMGLTYSTVPGRNYPLPIINYYKEFRPNWTYTLGVPKTNIRYYLNDTHRDAIQAYATLDNYFANIQQNFTPQLPDGNPDNRVAESLQFTSGVLGLGYEHFFTEHFLFFAYAAHTVYNNFRFEDGQGKKIFVINSENSPYFRAGLKFKY